MAALKRVVALGANLAGRRSSFRHISQFSKPNGDRVRLHEAHKELIDSWKEMMNEAHDLDNQNYRLLGQMEGRLHGWEEARRLMEETRDLDNKNHRRLGKMEGIVYCMKIFTYTSASAAGFVGLLCAYQHFKN